MGEEATSGQIKPLPGREVAPLVTPCPRFVSGSLGFTPPTSQGRRPILSKGPKARIRTKMPGGKAAIGVWLPCRVYLRGWLPPGLCCCETRCRTRTERGALAGRGEHHCLSGDMTVLLVVQRGRECGVSARSLGGREEIGEGWLEIGGWCR